MLHCCHLVRLPGDIDQQSSNNVAVRSDVPVASSISSRIRTLVPLGPPGVTAQESCVPRLMT